MPGMSKPKSTMISEAMVECKDHGGTAPIRSGEVSLSCTHNREYFLGQGLYETVAYEETTRHTASILTTAKDLPILSLTDGRSGQYCFKPETTAIFKAQHVVTGQESLEEGSVTMYGELTIYKYKDKSWPFPPQFWELQERRGDKGEASTGRGGGRDGSAGGET